ncbi:MAG: porin family protein [Bacteroidetes bacterium]|nr:porin family protein [Bacteroidota bacterium]
MKNLKTAIVFIIAIVAMINIGKAQEGNRDQREDMKLGIKIGTNISNVYNAQGEAFTADSKFGFVLGGFLTIPISKFIGIQPEFLFSQKGFKATGVILGSPYEFTRTTNYIDIPIFLTLKPAPSLTIMAGPQYSFLIKQSDAFTSTAVSTLQEQVFNTDNIRKNTFCFIWGVDVNFNSLVIGGRVGWDLYNNNGDGTSTTPRYKNGWYQLTLGLTF